MSHSHAFALVVAISLSGAVAAQDWTNAGGNAARNGMTNQRGPDSATTIWTTAPSSIIAWQPVSDGSTVYAVRQTGFPPEPSSNLSPIFAFDVGTGAQRWRKDIPFLTGQWTTWVAGVKNGRLYASRSGNGASVNAKVFCLDSATGAELWQSQDTVNAGPYDGVVFADNGDPIIADFNRATRINHATGATVWRVNRVCSVSSSCGGAIHNGALYVADAVVGGHAIKKFDLATGALLYQSTVMPGFTLQNTPFIGPDGTIYLSRTQNNAAVDFFYAFEDTGASLVQKWSVPAQWTTFSEYAANPSDGSVYMIDPGLLVTRRDSESGALIAQAESPIVNDGSNTTVRMAVDQRGNLYVSNGAFTNGRFYCYDENLDLLWSVPFASINIGGPSFGERGTLIVAGTGTNMRAYRTSCPSDVNEDGETDILDFLDFLDSFGTCDGSPAPCAGSSGVSADYNGDTQVDILDFLDFFDDFGGGC